MPFLDHLSELRSRIWWTFVGILGGGLLSYNWSDLVFSVLTSPIRSNFDNLQLMATGPADPFIILLTVSLATGAIISLPNTFYQLWIFIAPGLHDHERKLAVPFVLASTLCFVIGAVFCFYLVLPIAFRFFSGLFTSLELSPLIRITEYLSFVVKLLLVFGAMFEMPVLIFILGRVGVITHQQLKKNFRYAIVAIFVIAAIVTPPDAVTQLMLAVPLCALYWGCIYVCKYAETFRAL